MQGERGTGQCPGPAARQALAFSGSLGLAVFYFLGFIQNYQVPNPAPWRRLGIGCEIFLQSLVAGADDQFRGHQTNLLRHWMTSPAGTTIKTAPTRFCWTNIRRAPIACNVFPKPMSSAKRTASSKRSNGRLTNRCLHLYNHRVIYLLH